VVPAVVGLLVEGRSGGIACDPWTGLGLLAASVHETLQAQRTIVCTRDPSDLPLGRLLCPELDWHLDDPFAFLGALTERPDIVVSVLPFSTQGSHSVELQTESGGLLRCTGEFGSVLLAASASKLSANGMGIFIVPASFFFGRRSLVPILPTLGLTVEAALALPAGAFASSPSLTAYLVVVRRQLLAETFVAQLSQEINTNRQIVANMRSGRVDGALELGRLVPRQEFRGLPHLRLAEQLRHAELRFLVPPVRLEDLAQAIRLGRPGEAFESRRGDNAIYIPLIGISNVVDSSEAMTLKSHNYAQVVVDPMRSSAAFVARFLNSELGRFLREANQTGATIRRLNTAGLKELKVFVPRLETQRAILDVEALLGAQHNTLLGLQNDLTALQRELWDTPERLSDVHTRASALSRQLGIAAGPHAATTLDQWFETLPFPLASILRAWQATPSDDHKTRYEHLLHFFEAVAEFLSVIYLSAYFRLPDLFTEHRLKLAEAWRTQHLTLERATFGTWKVVVEYFAKQTRTLLSADADGRRLCAELFADPTARLPEMLARKELAAILSRTNKLRNDWTGHGGIVSPSEARMRNQLLLSEVQELRKAMADGWDHVQLVRSLYCRPRGGAFENEIALLVGSNSEFRKEPRLMSSWLDVDRLYLVATASSGTLLLLPLLQVGPSPSSAKNACYFFNRIDKDGARFVSYHFIDQPELKDQSAETSEAIHLLADPRSGDAS
jgi:hypothetical protein